MARQLKIYNVVGARPNFVKIAPILDAMSKNNQFDPRLIHTGQHYDDGMSDTFFRELQLPQPDVNLGVGSGSHGEQTAKILMTFERLLIDERPDLVLVVGDVNSTIACSLAAAKLQINVAHVEAGLRSYDRTMPEEVNRVLTDQIADYLFTTSEIAVGNLIREGIDEAKIHFVGNVMIDTLLGHKNMALKESSILEELDLYTKEYAVLTLHRPSNVDERSTLTEIVEAVESIQDKLVVVFPVHPRTWGRLVEFGLDHRLQSMRNTRIIEPLGYLDFLRLLCDATLVLTDSGGIQEETTVLGVPCITLRENTERPETVEQGTNAVVGNRRGAILGAFENVIGGSRKKSQIPEKWDGHAAERIVSILNEILEPA